MGSLPIEKLFTAHLSKTFLYWQEIVRLWHHLKKKPFAAFLFLKVCLEVSKCNTTDYTPQAFPLTIIYTNKWANEQNAQQSTNELWADWLELLYSDSIQDVKDAFEPQTDP